METARDPDSGEVVITFNFGDLAILQVWPNGRYCQTVFRDGTTVPAAPEDTEEYWERARSMGYSDPWLMCFEHEFLHSVLALAEGRAVSPTLWAVAHGTTENDPALIANEEAEVLKMQRKMNLCRSRL